jgi:DNA polymerase III subunit epsilon
VIFWDIFGQIRGFDTGKNEMNYKSEDIKEVINTFAAIDFETANPNWTSICSVGIVTVENGIIVDEFHALIKPPDNFYNWYNTKIHGISAEMTENEPYFNEVYPEIRKRLSGKKIVAHNESFDRNALKRTMALYGLDYAELNISDRWECTVKIFRKKGFRQAGLRNCCDILGIELNHHDALSDARACAILYHYSKENYLITDSLFSSLIKRS